MSFVASLALAVGGATLVPARVAFAQATQTSSADAQASREHFQRGRVFYEAHRWADAIDEFRQSLELSSSPNTRLLIARSLREMGGHTAEAYREFMAAAAEADERAPAEPRYAPIAGAARAEAQALVPQIAIMRIQLADPPPDTDVRLDGEIIPQSDWNAEIAIEPGRHRVEASAPGRQSFEREWTVTAGNAVQIAVTLGFAPTQQGIIEIPSTPRSQPGTRPIAITNNPPMSVPINVVPTPPQQPPSSGLATAGGVTLGVGIVLIVGGIVSGAVSLYTYNGLQADCGGGRCPPSVTDAQARVDVGRTTGTVCTVGLVSGGVLVITGAIMYATGRAQQQRVPEVLGRVYVDPVSGTVGVNGTF